MAARTAMDTETHIDKVGINGCPRGPRPGGAATPGTGTVGIHHGDIIVASPAPYFAIIALAADFVGVRAAEHVVAVSRAGHEVAPIRLITEVI